MTYKCGCHCGRIACEVDGTIEQLMDCNCSICAKRGYLHWFVPRDKFILRTPQSDLATYTFHCSGKLKLAWLGGSIGAITGRRAKTKKPSSPRRAARTITIAMRRINASSIGSGRALLRPEPFSGRNPYIVEAKRNLNRVSQDFKS